MDLEYQKTLDARCFQSDFDVVALAASAGGLRALTAVLSPLTPDFLAAIVVVQHLSPHSRSLLASILSRRTRLPVKQAEDQETLRPGNIYIAPPDHHLLVRRDSTLSLTHSEQVHFLRPSGDVLFESVANSFKDRAIAIVLTGSGNDGAEGVCAIKQAGGTVIVQDEATAEFFGMPGAAIETGCADYILPLEAIAPALTSLVMSGVSG